MGQNPGIFLTIEGAEGVGKSSVCASLVGKFKGLGREVKQTREPGGSLVADRIRELFVDPPAGEPLNPMTELLLISAARAQHVTATIQPALNSGKIVVCDRYADSTRVYQGVLGGIDAAFLESVIERSTMGLQPHLTLLLDCRAEIARKRAQIGREDLDRSGAKRYDDASLAVYEKMRQAYLQVAGRFPQRFVIIDASQSTEQVAAACWSHVQKKVLRL